MKIRKFHKLVNRNNVYDNYSLSNGHNKNILHEQKILLQEGFLKHFSQSYYKIFFQ